MKYLFLFIFFLNHAPVFGASQCLSLFENPKSKTVRLFDNEKPAKKYRSLIEGLQPGDQIDFGHRKIFTFYKELSDPWRGDLTTIIDIGNEKALRISRHYEYTEMKSPEDMAEEMNDWFLLMDELKQNGVPTVKVYRKESQPPQFIVVKKENFLFRLSDLFVKGKLSSANPVLKNVDAAVIKEALVKLVTFAEKTWMYAHIGDFRYEQLGYNGQEWILFDVGAARHRPLANFEDLDNTFSGESDDPYSGTSLGNFLPLKIRQKITEAIQQRRFEASQKGPWIYRKSTTGLFGEHNYLFTSLQKEPLILGQVFKVKSGNPDTSKKIPQNELDWWVEGKVSFKVISLLKTTETYSSYSVQLKDGSIAGLKVLRSNSDEDLKKVEKKVQSLSRSKLIAYGADFILQVVD